MRLHYHKGMGKMKGLEIPTMYNEMLPVRDMLAPNLKAASLLELLPDAVLFLDGAGKIQYANARAATMVGTSASELLGQTLLIGAPHLVTTLLYQAVREIVQTCIPLQVEYRSPVTQTWLRVYLTPTSEGIALFFHEEKEPKQPQEPVSSIEGTSLEVLERLSERIAIVTPEGLLLEINQSLLADTLVRREEVIGKPFTHFPTWSSAPDFQEQLSVAIGQASKGETIHFETRISPCACEHLDLSMTLTPHCDVNQQVEYLIWTGYDITAQKQAEEELRALVEAIPQLVWIAQPDGSIISSNQRWHNYLAMTTEQAFGDGWQVHLHPDDRQRVLDGRQAAISAGIPYELEYRLREGTSENYRWFLVRGIPCKDSQGNILRWFGTSTDIDEQKRTEEALRQSQERGHALMASNVIGIFIAEEDKIIESNEIFLRMTGYSQEDMQQQQMNCLHMTAPEYIDVTQQAHHQLKLYEYLPPYEKEYLCKDGSRLPVLVGGVMTQSDPTQSICFVLDNSARKALEQRKDTFLSMASHELRTPLTSLKLQTQMLKKQLAKQDLHKADVALSRMEGQLSAVTRLVEELFDLSKIQAGKLEYTQETVNLNDVLQEVVEVMQQTQTTHAIVPHVPERPVFLVGDRDRLGQVFLNLIGNAIKYSPDANQVEVNMTTSTETVTISICDHGMGIPQEQREKIFARFYRAVTPAQRNIPGLGMGLAIVSEIVKHYGGTITVEGEIGTGSTFHVTFPLNRQ